MDHTAFIKDIEKFQIKFGFETPKAYTNLSDELHKFRAAFIDEELAEFVEGCKTNDINLAIDSLIDLVYVVGGTVLFHGIDINEFCIFADQVNIQPLPKAIDILEKEEWQFTASYIGRLTAEYRNIHSSNLHKHEKHRQNIKYLAGIWSMCLEAAKCMGITPELWQALWDDVQRANMSKEKAVSDTQSKRGSAVFDVIKPAGWVGPNTGKVIEDFYKKDAA